MKCISQDLGLIIAETALVKVVNDLLLASDQDCFLLSLQCNHWLYPRSESRRLVVLTDAVDGSVWKACDQETAVDRATWGLSHHHRSAVTSVSFDSKEL
ncbi:hypothetical protein QTP70_032349, partial [Hemibagrus guttatus]